MSIHDTRKYIADAVEQAEKEFMANRPAELATEDAFGLFVEADKAAADALARLCKATTSLELNEAQAEINDLIRNQANISAAREWFLREPAVYFAAEDAERAMKAAA